MERITVRRKQKTEDRGRKTEDRERRTEDRGRKTEDRGRRTEDRERRTFQMIIDNCGKQQKPADGGQRFLIADFILWLCTY